MARNRKNEAAIFQMGRTFFMFFACLIVGGAGIGFVSQKNQIIQLGQQKKRSEQHLAQLRDQNDKLRRQLATVCSPQFVELRIKELNLGLVQPQPTQVWRLVEPSGAMASVDGRARATQLASQPPTSLAMP
jgi:cell division protein FtsB